MIVRNCITLLPLSFVACSPAPVKNEMVEDPEPTAYVVPNVAAADAAMLADIREGLDRDIPDSESARFKGVRVWGTTACGEFNAKNEFGAYQGYERFISSFGFIEREKFYLIGADTAVSANDIDLLKKLNRRLKEFYEKFEECTEKGRKMM